MDRSIFMIFEALFPQQAYQYSIIMAISEPALVLFGGGGGRTQAFCRIQGHIWLLHRFKLVLVLGHRRLYYS